MAGGIKSKKVASVKNMATNPPPNTSIRCSNVLIVLCVLLVLFGCIVNSSDFNLNCFERSIANWNVSIRGQTELDNFVENITSFTDENTDKCIRLFLTEKSYKLDVIRLMKIKLGAGGGLVVVGAVSPRVKITCATSVSRSALEELRNISRPISKVSLVALYGLIFMGCPVPLVFEEVSTVVVQNCDFM